MKKIIAFSGSNSSQSINQQFIHATAKLVEGAEVKILNLRDFEAPMYSIDLEMAEGFPASMTTLKAELRTADGFIISTPEHNGSMPAVLKNTIDWLSRIEQKVFDDKPAVFLSTSPGPRGGATALEHLSTIMPYRGANVVGSYSLGSFNDHVKEAQLSDEKKAELSPLLEQLVKSL